MVFSSIPFLFYFLPVTLILYFIAPRKLKNAVLLTVSIVFYSWGEPVYIVLMVISILINYLFGLKINKRLQNNISAKSPLVLGIAVNLFLLGFFKYADFLIDNLNGFLSLGIGRMNLPLPLGISFYTFQAMSYIIDLYRGDVKVQKNIVNFGTYVALFPQLIAGPIVKMKTIASELDNRKESFDDFASGAKRFVTGLGKKVLLANNIGLVWTQIHSMNISELPVLTAWIGILAFTFQIYFDFSGYSDMAIGLGRIFGFHFLENFDYPYISRDITEFWRRWHISLSTWFKEYLYIPLGGNRFGLLKQIRNIIIVWLLTGFWHGAAWNFVIWGVYFGIILIFEKVFLLKVLKKIPGVLRHIYTMLLVVISWVFFSADNIHQALCYIKNMFGGYGNNFYDSKALYILSNNLILLILLAVGCTPLVSKFVKKIVDVGTKTSAFFETFVMVGIFILVTAYLVSSSYNPFLYFRF